MNKTEIESKIKEIDLELKELREIDEKNSAAYGAAQNELHVSLLGTLKDAGLPVDANTTLNTYLYKNPAERNASIRFYVTPSWTISMEIENRKVKNFSVSGMSTYGDNIDTDLSKMADYYGLVAVVLDKLTSKYFAKNMSLFFDLLENWTAPEAQKTGKRINDLEGEKRELEKLLVVAGLELEVGKTVEIRVSRGSGRYARDYWNPVTVSKITPKLVVVSDNFGTNFQVKKDHVSFMLRSVKAEN
jgi:hypothetical protein